MINFNANVSGSGMTRVTVSGPEQIKAGGQGSAFGETVKAVENQFTKVDGLQQSSDMSITDLLTGRNEDITSVVSEVAKADMSFKLLVGVRNKLIEAYKQTMNMQL